MVVAFSPGYHVVAAFSLYELCPDLHPCVGSDTLSWMQEAVRMQKAVWK